MFKNLSFCLLRDMVCGFYIEKHLIIIPFLMLISVILIDLSSSLGLLIVLNIVRIISSNSC